MSTIAAILDRKGRDVLQVAGDVPLLDLVALLHEKRIGAVLVQGEAGAIAGVVSERDIVRALAQNGAAALTLPAQAVMTTPVVTCQPENTVSEAMAQMTRRRFRHLPVLDAAGQLVGIVSIGDLVKGRIDQVQQEAEQLLQYISAG